MRAPFAAIQPTPDEVAATLPGDDVVPDPDVVMDRAFALPAPPERVWPWFVQLGRRRAGWYLPRRVERFLPPRGRALRHIEPSLQTIAVGDVIPDWPGRDDTFELHEIDPPHVLVHRSKRRAMYVSWAIVLRAAGDGTRVHIRLRVGPVKRRWLVLTGGEAIDLLTIAGLAAGLRERLGEHRPA